MSWLGSALQQRQARSPKWDTRFQSNAAMKQAAARACLDSGLVRRFDRIFLDCGSTFVYLADEVFSRASSLSPLTLFTTNSEVFQRYLSLQQSELIDFHLIGGRFIPNH